MHKYILFKLVYVEITVKFQLSAPFFMCSYLDISQMLI